MTNLKKLGLTALAGSLVAVSAHAGEMSVSGSADVTYKTGGADNAAQSLGHNTDITFSGSGELDNGYEVNMFVAYADGATLESSAVSVTMGSMGTLGVSKIGGMNINGAYDETYPRAYEENSDAGGQSASNYVGSAVDDNALIYMAPSINIAGVDISAGVEYSFQAGSGTTNDGGTIARSDDKGTGYGVGVTASVAGLTFGAYASEAENIKNGGNTPDNDEFTGSIFANYSFGPVSIGYQQTYVDSGVSITGNAPATTAAKTVGTSGGIFEDTSMSIAFNVNDNLSVSYSETEGEYDAQTYDAGTTTKTARVKQDTDSLQVAYSMGAMSVKAYKTEIKNPNYDQNAAELEVNEIAIGLAF